MCRKTETKIQNETEENIEHQPDKREELKKILILLKLSDIFIDKYIETKQLYEMKEFKRVYFNHERLYAQYTNTNYLMYLLRDELKLTEEKKTIFRFLVYESRQRDMFYGRLKIICSNNYIDDYYIEGIMDEVEQMHMFQLSYKVCDDPNFHEGYRH